MGVWNPVPGALTGVIRHGGPKRLQSGTATAEEQAAGDARFREMAVERRAPMARPTWKPESTQQALGRPIETRAEYDAECRRRGLVEVSSKNPDAGITTPKVDIAKIQREAFAAGRKDLAEGKPIYVPKPGQPPMQVIAGPQQPALGSMTSMFESAKRRVSQGDQLLCGTDTGEPTTFAFTEPKSTNNPPDRYDAFEAQAEGQQRMIDKLYARGAPGL